MTVKYLADTSAIGRLHQDLAAVRWVKASDAGVIALCDPVELEVLRKVPGGLARRAMRHRLRDTFPLCFTPDTVWDRALEIQSQLAERSQHFGTSAFDLVIAAIAMHHRLIVLHDDRDYETISRVTGLPVQRITD